MIEEQDSPVQPTVSNAPHTPSDDHPPAARDAASAAKRLHGTTANPPPVLLLFMLSGAAGLIYEVVWSRQLVLVFGNTTQAVSAILTGFFGGMAIGSIFGGRLADRVRRPLRLYGLIELLLVVVVLCTPLTFLLIKDVYRGIFSALVAAPHMLALVRFGLSLLALGPATILMGATLPTLTRYLARTSSELSSAFGRLYAANTGGAILGTLIAGIVLIELLGLSGTLRVGAACSAIAGIVALLFDRTQASAHPDVGGATHSTPEPPARSIARDSAGARGSRIRLALLVAFVSGLTSLGYQVLWTRLLSSGTGNSTYVFTTILGFFLIGLVLGAIAFTSLRGRVQTITLLAVGQVVIALLVLLGMIATTGLAGTDIGLLSGVIVVVLPATFVMGLTFPASSALIQDTEGRVGSDSGLLLFANTLGSITGTFLIPFVVVPLVGSPVALGLIALLNLAAGIALALYGRIPAPFLRRFTAGAGAVATVAVVISLTMGTIFVDPNVAHIHRSNGVVAMSLEDEIASVQAGTANDFQQLWVAGTSMTVLTIDTKLMPLLPLMMRPQSKTELTIAFGMGSAFRSALNAGLTATAVELVPSVPKTFGVFYPDASAVLDNPNGHVVVADGRNYVELTDKRYDIIVTDPPPPVYSSGVSVIASREFYQAAKSRLTPGGVMMEWMPYAPSVDEFKASVRSYLDVFPHVTIAFSPAKNGVYMLGSERPMTFDPAAIRQVLTPRVVEDLSGTRDAGLHDADSWAALIPTLVWLQDKQVAKFAGPGPRVTDDQPLPEYFLLRSRFSPPSPMIGEEVLRSLTPAP